MNKNLKLQLIKVINANRAKVFAAWSDPNIVKKWWDLSQAELDFKVGGTYTFVSNQSCEGTETKKAISGTYKKIIPNELIVFSFTHASFKSIVENLVTIAFKDVKDGTEITLTHEQIPDEENQGRFTQGWGSALDKLQQFFKQ